MLTRTMKSEDPYVAEAARSRLASVESLLVRAREWVSAYGGLDVHACVDGDVFRVDGLIAPAAPRGWHVLSAVDDERGPVCSPPEGSEASMRMLDLFVPFGSVPGLPGVVAGEIGGTGVLAVPAVFVHEGVAYFQLPFDPPGAQSASVHQAATRRPCDPGEFEQALVRWRLRVTLPAVGAA